MTASNLTEEMKCHAMLLALAVKQSELERAYILNVGRLFLFQDQEQAGGFRQERVIRTKGKNVFRRPEDNRTRSNVPKPHNHDLGILTKDYHKIVDVCGV